MNQDRSSDAPLIEFYFDVSSPWTYLAFEAIQPMAMELGVGIDWKPILVGGVFNSVNPSVYEFREKGVPAKQRYLSKDLADWSRHAGLSILWPPSVFPVNSVKVMRACIALDAEGRLVPFARAAFQAYWTEDQDISGENVIAGLCRECGINASSLLERIEESDIKSALRFNTDELIDRGGFGSPTMFLNRDDMYFGNDRLELLREAVLRQGAAQNPAE